MTSGPGTATSPSPRLTSTGRWRGLPRRGSNPSDRRTASSTAAHGSASCATRTTTGSRSSSAREVAVAATWPPQAGPQTAQGWLWRPRGRHGRGPRPNPPDHRPQPLPLGTVVAAIADLPLIASGKVRELYDLGDSLLLVASDRISTYDVVHPTPIPDKGAVLTGLSTFWFEQTSGIVAGHLESVAEGVPDEVLGRAMIVRKLR